MHLSRIRIENFRNFAGFDVALGGNDRVDEEWQFAASQRVLLGGALHLPPRQPYPPTGPEPDALPPARCIEGS